jgi:hypothetical protein
MKKELHLWRSDDYVTIKELQHNLARAELEAADREGRLRRVGDPSPVGAAAVELNNFIAEAEGRMISVTVNTLGPLKVQRMRDRHTVERETRKERAYVDESGQDVKETSYDVVRDLNQEAFAFELVRTCLIDPVFTNDDALDEWIETHGNGTFAYLWSQLNEMHADTAAVGDPKSWLVSAGTHISDET